MLKGIQLAALGTAVLLAAGTVNARGTGGPGFERSKAAPPVAQAPMSAMHQAMRAQGDPPAATDGWRYVGGEAGWVRDPQAAGTPAARVAGMAAQPYGEVAADGWTFVGGEAGWIREPHRYEFRGGRLVYVDNDRFPHDTPQPAKPTRQEQAATWSIFGGS